MDPWALIQRCLDGDDAAWRSLMDHHAGLVFAIARRHGLRPDQCEDVAQSVFSALARALPNIRNPEALVGWLGTSARREAWRVVKAERRHARDRRDDEPDTPPGDEELHRLEAAHRVRAALQRLDERCRDLLSALFIQPGRVDYQQLSERLSIPVGSIGPTRARCLGKLATLLEPAAGTDDRPN